MEEKETLLGWIKESDNLRLVPHKDYEIKYDGDNFYLVKKKKKYPKTYEECCEIFGYNENLKIYRPFNADIPEYDSIQLFNSLEILRKLLICRDAYWKITGDEMGLGKPWEPDWEDESDKFTIGYFYNGIDTNIIRNYESHPLAFPTKEMRDAFYENFKDLIEQCREFL